MAINADLKIIKEKKIGKTLLLKISRHIFSGRIFVEFSSENPRMVLQKNFADDIDGKIESEDFIKSITSSDELREYFGIRKK